MARHEQDREDLLAEASALVERASVRCLGAASSFGAESVIGFRRDGSASFYLHPQRVYQFNARGQLRRAFVDDRLFKAERGKWIALTRERTAEQVWLVRQELETAATDAFVERVRVDLASLQHALHTEQFELLGQVPSDGEVLARVRVWLGEHAAAIGIAHAAGL